MTDNQLKNWWTIKVFFTTLRQIRFVLWLMILHLPQRQFHYKLCIYCFISPAWPCWSSPDNYQLWCRPHMFPSVHIWAPSWQFQQPKIVRFQSKWRHFHCHPGKSLSFLQEFQHRTCYLSGLVCWTYRYFSSLWLNYCISPDSLKEASHTSAYLLTSAGLLQW